VNRSPALIDALLGEQADPDRRAAGLVEAMRLLSPSLSLHACALRETDRVYARVLGAAGQLRPDCEEVLKKEYLRRAVPGDSAAWDLILSKVFGLANHVLVREEFTYANRHHGMLAVALSETGAPESALAARTLLTTMSRHLALRLTVEAQEHEQQTLLNAVRSETALADIGELAAPVFHEVNNFLNALLLEFAILEPAVAEKFRPRLDEIRRQGKDVAALIKQVQQHRRTSRAPPQPIDINGVIARVVEDLRIEVPVAPNASAGTVALQWNPVSNLPLILGNASNVRRLLFFLIKNAAAALGSEGRAVTIHTERADGLVRCHVEDDGPVVSPKALARLFDPGAAGRPGANRLELAACQSIVRRLQGKIEATNRPEGGLRVTVELPATGSS
jgi:signal transduction histidine kinase